MDLPLKSRQIRLIDFGSPQPTNLDRYERLLPSPEARTRPKQLLLQAQALHLVTVAGGG